MRRFKFRLEKLLDLRRYREREWEMKLASVVGVIMNLKRGIGDRAGHIVSALRGRGYAVGPLDLSALRANELYVYRLDREIDSLQRELSVQEEKRQEIQGHYAEASRKKKVLEKLKERRASDYYREQRREEFKEMDDINTARAKERGEVPP